jgi:hypothetical protein
MHGTKIEVGEVRGSWGLLEMSEEEVAFYQRFVARHGGALVRMGETEGSYRLDFPPGTRIAPNEELGVPLEDSYHIVYPDGTRLTWYRVMKLDRRWMYNVLLAPADDEEWACLKGQEGQQAG